MRARHPERQSQASLAALASVLLIFNCAATAAAKQPPVSHSKHHHHKQEPISAHSSNVSFEPADNRVSLFRLGQPETFSSGATGLGDLEASDSLKKMNKRSVSFDGSQRLRRSFEDWQRLVDKRRKAIVRATSEAARARQSPERRAAAGAQTPFRSLLGAVPGKRFYALHRISPHYTYGIDDNIDDEGAIEDQDSHVVEPIIISRRTEELLEPPVSQMDLFQQEQQFDEDEPIDKFPLLGEFGSRVSLMTTRKAQPYHRSPDHRLLLDRLSHRFEPAEEQEPESAHDMSSAYQLDDAVPVSSQVLINSAKVMKHQQRQRADEQAGLQQPVATRRVLVVGESRPTGETTKENPREKIGMMDYIDGNYLPRIARGRFM